ncbi:MAG: cell division protein FtsL [Buchnera aphidicola (Chaetogeoica yunlongensis)]
MDKNYNLSKIILDDMLSFHKTQIALLFMILFSSILLVIIIHKTRLLISEIEKLKKESIKLSINKNLQLKNIYKIKNIK